jgi:hypothetical protein
MLNLNQYHRYPLQEATDVNASSGTIPDQSG